MCSDACSQRRQRQSYFAKGGNVHPVASDRCRVGYFPIVGTVWMGCQRKKEAGMQKAFYIGVKAEQ